MGNLISTILSMINKNESINSFNDIIICSSKEELIFLVNIIKIGLYSKNPYKNNFENFKDQTLIGFIKNSFEISKGDAIDFILNVLQKTEKEKLIDIFSTSFLEYKNELTRIESCLKN